MVRGCGRYLARIQDVNIGAAPGEVTRHELRYGSPWMADREGNVSWLDLLEILRLNLRLMMDI
jgi:hypothetical protein